MAALPQRVGGYRLVRELGGGSYGTTYLAHDALGKPVALKWLKQDAPDDGPARFANEIYALKKIDHNAFPKFVASGKEKDRPYIVMSYFEGLTIEELIEANCRGHSFIGGVQTLLIAQRILEGLAYLHTQPKLVHRDLKAANVMVSLSGDNIRILDLGQCKGPAVPAKEETFWNIGASRISPPSKLENPSMESPSHDIFAVGVLCYQMLTNRYPWEVSEGKDAGHLKRKMLRVEPVPIMQLNNAVDHRAANLIMRMMDTQDFSRIDAPKAIDELEKLRTVFEEEFLARGHTPAPANVPLKLTRVVRDAIYGDIPMSDLEFKMINTQEFQRLRKIRQLGTTHLVYPGAEHTRFAHALGTLFITERILSTIELREGVQFLNEDRSIARAFALLHDITHAPFGHTLEDELGFFHRHDTNKKRLERLIHRRSSELGPVLTASEVGRRTLDLIYKSEQSEGLGWVTEAVSSPVGADVIDYINRDAFHCGLDHRVDSAIFRRFAIETSPTRSMDGRHLVPQTFGSHGFRPDAEYAISSVLRERHALFLKVYSHPTKVSAGAMIGKALSEAIEFTPAKFDEERIERMGDDELLFRLQTEGGSKSSGIVDRYHRRHIYKPAYMARLLKGGMLNKDGYDAKYAELLELGALEPQSRLRLEREIAEEAGVEASDVILYATSRAPGAQRVVQRVMSGRGQTRTRNEAFGLHQEIYRNHLTLWNAYLFVAQAVSDDKKALIASIGDRIFGIPNEVLEDRRQLALQI